MPPVIAILFWAWVVVSVVLLVHRRRAKGRPATEDVPSAEAATEVAAPADVVTDAPVAVPAEPVPAVAAAMAMAPAGMGAPPAGLAPTPPPARRERSVPAAGIADALLGIRMPCDLVPLVVDRLSDRRVTLSTVGYPAEVVGTALADEVERLGYVITPRSDREIDATRGTTSLRLTITPPGVDGRHHDHPSARDGAVVVAIELLS